MVTLTSRRPLSLRAEGHCAGAGAAAWRRLSGRKDSGPEADEAGHSALQHSVSVRHRMRRRWKRPPIRSLLCKRPRKWLKSAPCRPQTSPLPRKALESGRGWGGAARSPLGTPSRGFLGPRLGWSWLGHRALLAGTALLSRKRVGSSPHCGGGRRASPEHSHELGHGVSPSAAHAS